MPGYTPMMKQYLEIKKDYQDSLLFFRLGDFYELFFDDALTAVKELDIALTKKSCGKNDGEPIKVDMCGVPFHSVDGYISKLVSKGYKIAICEQIEDSKNALGSIVKRDVVRIITAGTVIDTNMLEETKNNYIMCIFENKIGFAIAVSDVSTGEFLTMEFSLGESSKVIDEIAKYNPSEIIANDSFSLKHNVLNIFGIRINHFTDYCFKFENAKNALLRHFNIGDLTCFDIDNSPLLICVCGGLISYLLDTQKNNLSHVVGIKKYHSGKYMFLDISSRRNLELTETIREKSKRGSLLWVLDKTKTPMGARLIRKWVEQPLIDKKEIEYRLDAVEDLFNNPIMKAELKEDFAKIKDIERIIGKVSYQTANARDLTYLKASFENLENIKNILNHGNVDLFQEIHKNFDTLSDLYDLIDNSIHDEPPFSVREGGIIKDGYNSEVDNLRGAKNQGATWLINLENREREKTGIKNLKIKYNKIFGYYIEITNSNLGLAPDEYVRKQTLANGERFVTDELKEIEEAILGADEKVTEIEYQEFCKIRNHIADNIQRIQKTANFIAIIDVIISFAEVAEKNNYAKPSISQSEDNNINIKLGRHPVVELLTDEQFIPNDTFLNTEKKRLSIITGPNMAGKSTYMRQVALIVLMAQIGSFVPAKSADISIADRIFTRVGASDDLATGKSTFMIEMSEVANILNNANKNSLLILDEIGRGTSTFDGLSIAWAVLEYISDKSKIGARTLFATHYHELTSIENKLDGITNYCVEIKDNGDDVIFLRNIVKGFAEKSFGIQVAKIAGIPNQVIERAKELLELLNKNDINITSMATYNYDSDEDVENFKYTASNRKGILFVDEMAKEFKELDMNNITPMDAWKRLFSIKNKLDNI